MTNILKKIPLNKLRIAVAVAVFGVVIVACVLFYRSQLSHFLSSHDINTPEAYALQSIVKTQLSYELYEKQLVKSFNTNIPFDVKRLQRSGKKFHDALTELKKSYPSEGKKLWTRVNELEGLYNKKQEGNFALAALVLVSNDISSLLVNLEQKEVEIQTQGLTDINKENNFFIRLLDIFIVIMVIGIVGVSYIIYQLINKPFNNLLPVFQRVLKGDIETAVPFKDEPGVLGSFAESVGEFQDHIEKLKEMHANEVMMNQYSDEREMQTHTIVNEFEIKVKKLVNTFKSAAILLQNATHNMNITIEKTTHESSEAKKSAIETSQNVQSASEATQKLSQSFQEISKKIHSSSKVVDSAVNKSKRADEIVKTLSGSAHAIGEVLSYITKIASQINMLSLNATIESERAGEAGKGFAVVASEVKGLAVQTAKATQDIDNQVSEIRTVTESVVDVIDEMKAAISEISILFNTISQAVENQDQTTIKLFENMNETSEHIQVLSESITHSADTSTHAEEAAKTVTKAADIVKQSSNELSGDISEFLEQIKLL